MDFFVLFLDIFGHQFRNRRIAELFNLCLYLKKVTHNCVTFSVFFFNLAIFAKILGQIWEPGDENKNKKQI